MIKLHISADQKSGIALERHIIDYLRKFGDNSKADYYVNTFFDKSRGHCQSESKSDQILPDHNERGSVDFALSMTKSTGFVKESLNIKNLIHEKITDYLPGSLLQPERFCAKKR